MTRNTKGGLLSSEPDPITKDCRPHLSAFILRKSVMKVKTKMFIRILTGDQTGF